MDILENYFQISADVTKNLSKHWCSDSLETKRRIQELVFKGSLSLDVKNRTYLTKEINYVFELSAELTRDAEGVNEKRQLNIQLPSSKVAGARTFLKEGQARTDALPFWEGYEL